MKNWLFILALANILAVWSVNAAIKAYSPDALKRSFDCNKNP